MAPLDFFYNLHSKNNSANVASSFQPPSTQEKDISASGIEPGPFSWLASSSNITSWHLKLGLLWQKLIILATVLQSSQARFAISPFLTSFTWTHFSFSKFKHLFLLVSLNKWAFFCVCACVQVRVCVCVCVCVCVTFGWLDSLSLCASLRESVCWTER